MNLTHLWKGRDRAWGGTDSLVLLSWASRLWDMRHLATSETLCRARSNIWGVSNQSINWLLLNVVTCGARTPEAVLWRCFRPGAVVQRGVTVVVWGHRPERGDDFDNHFRLWWFESILESDDDLSEMIVDDCREGQWFDTLLRVIMIWYLVERGEATDWCLCWSIGKGKPVSNDW